MAVDAPAWVEVQAISAGLDDNRLPATEELAGREMVLRFENGSVVACSFTDGSALNWNVTQGPHSGASAQESYEAVRVSPDVVLVSLVRQGAPLTSVTAALDLTSRRATIVVGTMPTLEEARTDLITRMKSGLDLSPVRVEFLHARLDPHSADEPVAAHQRTTDLVGKRVRYTYGDGAVYEHIYLNEQLYTWHCLAGPERGLADTERCDYFRITRNVVLFSWHEKIVPTLGVVLVNTDEMRSTGILFGIDTETGAPSHFGIGARGELLNVTASGIAKQAD